MLVMLLFLQLGGQNLVWIIHYTFLYVWNISIFYFASDISQMLTYLEMGMLYCFQFFSGYFKYFLIKMKTSNGS